MWLYGTPPLPDHTGGAEPLGYKRGRNGVRYIDMVYPPILHPCPIWTLWRGTPDPPILWHYIGPPDSMYLDPPGDPPLLMYTTSYPYREIPHSRGL